MLLETCSSSDPDRLESSQRSVSLAFPSVGSLLLFDGELLHAVLHAPTASAAEGQPPLATGVSEAAPRITLLVNFWAEGCPPGATDAPLPSLAQWGAAPEEGPAASGCEEPPVRMRLRAPLARDAEWWRQQRLPPAVAEALRPRTVEGRAMPLASLEYDDRCVRL